MSNDRDLADSRVVGRGSTSLRDVLRLLPEGGLEQQAVEAGEIDAIIDYGNANVIMFPAARRALRAAYNRASAASRRTALDEPAANAVLAALPRMDYQRLLPNLEAVTFEFGDVLQEADALIRHVYFPVDCVVCLLMGPADQRAVEIGMVGYEGVVGISLALGVDVSPVRALVQSPGTAWRIPAAQFNDALRRCLPLQHELHRVAHTKLVQARRTAACFASHLLEQRIACWLLMTSDRSRSQEVFMTQEYLASVFNVRRESVTFSSGALRARNLISCHRGKICILDCAGLEAASCSCYRSIDVLCAAR